MKTDFKDLTIKLLQRIDDDVLILRIYKFVLRLHMKLEQARFG